MHNQRPSGAKQPAPRNMNMSASAPNTVEADNASGGVVINGGSKLEALREQLVKDEKKFEDFIGNAGKEEQVGRPCPHPRAQRLQGLGFFAVLQGNCVCEVAMGLTAEGIATLEIHAHVKHPAGASRSVWTALSPGRLGRSEETIGALPSVVGRRLTQHVFLSCLDRRR